MRHASPKEEAKVVRRIFCDYAAGKSPREIASSLNKEGVEPPRGKLWAASTINGNRSRHYGILINELYAGRLIWNRVRMIKDPDTGKRISRPNPQNEWKREDVPHLAIIDEELFGKVQARKAARSCEYPARKRKPKRLLSGLLKCHKCGGGISVKDRDHGRIRVHCTIRRESGSCDNRKIYYLDQIESAVLSGLQEHLQSPELLAEFVETYRKERLRLVADKQRGRSKLEAKIARIHRSMDRIWAEYDEELLDMKIAGPRLKALDNEREALELQLGTLEPEPNIVSLHPTAISRYEQYVANLSQAFEDGISDENEEAALATITFI